MSENKRNSMNEEEFASSLMDKLAGDLSENEVNSFEAQLSQDKSMQDDYKFFSQAWRDLGELSIANPEPSLSDNFYERLKLQQLKEERRFPNRLKSLVNELIYTSSPLARNISFCLFLLAFGFILGGNFNTKKIEVNQNMAPTEIAPQQYIPSTQKIQQVNAIASQNSEQALGQLMNIVSEEQNTNVRLAALHQLGQHSSNPALKKFYLQQLEIETSPLIQVELLNLYMENSKTKESINTMESLLAKSKLDPNVQEKIRKDLPVLRASFIE